ncbi:hypothetical protein MINTM008_50730 [Mycobacterium intracellulare]|uniref:Uncharacterized protein n=1 Tax=Mycobacterium paraintracellulare TaxID=1138383 RepID=A0ABM7K5S4_9MYCO|nr:hypothetical protein MPRI_14670 [Mycobacterium paraintracellulare]BCO49131.1 hypothetical protein MINTM002_48050 [Mycobacterium intracellulare]BCP39491.1 hypothetical protein MINTMi198_48610 [Mycobacterium intracellulare M.i.198]BCO54350.1 hypothetical protein MINTM003_47910 [Mycobacterium paraintracellulare]BCO59641.1 hypothetical protein MINTM005_48850 [Mycobacterium intracellulare]
MVAASSYQKEGRAAPAMLTATASAATSNGSSAAATAGRRLPSTPGLNTSLWCQNGPGGSADRAPDSNV